jgi:integrase
LGHLRTVLRWAYGDQAPKIERPAKPAPKERYLTHAEIERLLAAPAAPHIKLAIHLMLATGARVGAILELTWDRVDFERGQINLRTDATGPRKGRAVVPINAGLRAALQTMRSVACPSTSSNGPAGPWRRSRRASTRP